MYSTISVDVSEPIGFITLNRPKVLNAINRTMTEEVTAAMDEFQRDDRVRVIVVHGAGRAFSAGFDLAVANGPSNLREWRDYIQADYDFILQFWNSPKPTIAAVHGYCLAGAFEVALACDMTIAAEGTRFGEPEVRFGSGIVAMLLPWVVGAKVAKELFLTGIDKVDAERALAVGIVNRVVPVGEELAVASAMARDIAAASQTSVRMTKRALNASYEAMGLRQGLQAGLDACMLITGMGDPEHDEFERIKKAEGLKAALAWRDARFSS